MPVSIKWPWSIESLDENTFDWWWLKKEGDSVEKDDPLVLFYNGYEIYEEYKSPVAGRLIKILVYKGKTVAEGTEIGLIEETPYNPTESDEQENKFEGTNVVIVADPIEYETLRTPGLVPVSPPTDSAAITPSEHKQESAKVLLENARLITLAALLNIAQATIIFVCALLADSIILGVIKWSYSDVLKEGTFLGNIFYGMQTLSLLGTGVGYFFYVIRSFFTDLTETVNLVREKLQEIRAPSH